MTEMICQKIVSDYLETLKNGIEITQRDGGYIVSLPFVSWSGHYLEIHVRQLTGNYIALSDMENEIAELWLSGMRIFGRHRSIIQDIITQYDVRLEGDEILAQVPLSKAGETVHRLVQALIRIGDLSLLHRIIPIKETPITKRVRKLLQDSRIEFIAGPRATLNGKISKRYQLDFLIRNGRGSAIKTVEAKIGLRTKVLAFAFEFYDIKGANPEIERVGIYDETNKWDEDLVKIAESNTEIILPIQNKEEILSRIR